MWESWNQFWTCDVDWGSGIARWDLLIFHGWMIEMMDNFYMHVMQKTVFEFLHVQHDFETAILRWHVSHTFEFGAHLTKFVVLPTFSFQISAKNYLISVVKFPCKRKQKYWIKSTSTTEVMRWYRGWAKAQLSLFLARLNSKLPGTRWLLKSYRKKDAQLWKILSICSI